MNPAVINYLQSQQNVEQQPVNNPPYNPFDNGIKKAIESARVSLGMSPDQEDAAMRSSILSFGKQMATEPKQRGFLKNLGAVGRSLGPAVESHDEYEASALKDNNNLANQILAYNAAEENKKERAEERAWRKQHAQAQLNEQRRQHDLMSGYHKQKLDLQEKLNAPPEAKTFMGEEFAPIENKVELAAYAKDKRALGSVLNEVTDLEKSYKKFRSDYKNNLVDTMSPSSYVMNPIKDYFGRFTNNQLLRKETADRKTLGSQLNKFVISSERALKGGGVMGPRLIEMFKEQGIYPDLDTDTPEIFESKLKMFKEEIENSYKAANLSLQHGVRIDPYQLRDMEERKKQQEEGSIEEPVQIEDIKTESAPQIIMMQDSQGNTFQIPSPEVDDAIKDGLMPIKE